jgi:lysyl-tRNA synthetase class 2
MTVPEWRPTADLQHLRYRAAALATVRAFFAARSLLEVETPAIVAEAVSDPQLANIACRLGLEGGRAGFLHTSPEYHMKRLLAAGAPDIYQICKVFRDGELGARHLPEFTLVEWYRRGIGFDAMIAESCALIAGIGASLGKTLPTPVRLSYPLLFRELLGIDPLGADSEAIRDGIARARPAALDGRLTQALGDDRDAWLDLAMVTVIEPALAGRGLVVIDRYPASQAALARLDPAAPGYAERFEIYLHGIELANGFHELADALEQERRFQLDREQRRRRGLPDVAPDERLLAALRSGLPDCCGVALGLDRVLMAVLDLGQITRVVSFAVPERD